jgi:hypothetical protein
MLVQMAISGLLAFASSQSSIPSKLIPAKFQGEWNGTLADCGTGDNDSRLIITADSLHFYESSGRVRGVFLNGPFEILVVADMVEEGSTWLDSKKFVLSGKGNSIALVSETGSRFVRYRCASK